jgi:hypothetical protein
LEGKVGAERAKRFRSQRAFVVPGKNFVFHSE